MTLNRRRFVEILSGLSGAAALGAWSTGRFARASGWRLDIRPPRAADRASPGLIRLGLHSDRDSHLLVPRIAQRANAVPLVVGLHGAGMRGMDVINYLDPLAQQFGFLVLAPDSRDVTWDAIAGRVGPDIEFLSRSIEACMTRHEVDRQRIYLQGFSDGASYALTVGRVNGDFFPRIVAFSPGFVP